MFQRNSNPSSQICERPSAYEYSPHTSERSDNSLNMNGKRSRGNLQMDQVETSRKLARLEGDPRGEREESQQPSNPIANTSSPQLEQQFVDGPGHIVFIDEGGKLCPAMCFNKGLVSTFIRIAVMSRELLEKDAGIQKAQFELEKIKSSNQSARMDEAKKKVEEAIKIHEDVEAEIPELVEARRRLNSLTQENKWSKLSLDNTRAAAQFVIDQILNSENLLNIPKPKPKEPVEVNQDHSAKPRPVPEDAVHDIQKPDMPKSSPASSTIGTQSMSDNEEQLTPRQLALRRFRWAGKELDFRKRQFALMQEELAQAVAANERHQGEQQPDRLPSTTQTDNDLKDLRKKQWFTRKVIEAEEEYDRAEQHAEALGLGDMLADPEACYWGEEYNNFLPRSPGSPPVVPGDRARIEAWMASVPDFAVMNSQRQEDAGSAEVDDWEAKSVEVFDSISLVARDMYRQKIDKWQELSGRMRADNVKGPSPESVRRNPRRHCRGRPSPGGNPRTKR